MGIDLHGGVTKIVRIGGYRADEASSTWDAYPYSDSSGFWDIGLCAFSPRLIELEEMNTPAYALGLPRPFFFCDIQDRPQLD